MSTKQSGVNPIGWISCCTKNGARRQSSIHVRGFVIWHLCLSLLDDTYNKADVIDILNGLLAILKVTVEKDQKDTTHTFGEILRQALLQADKGGVEIHPDIECLDNVYVTPFAPVSRPWPSHTAVA